MSEGGRTGREEGVRKKDGNKGKKIMPNIHYNNPPITLKPPVKGF